MWHNIIEEHIIHIHCCHRFWILDPGSAQQLRDPTADEGIKSEI